MATEQYVNLDHATWYQAASDEDRAQHMRASHWPAWRETPEAFTTQQHADWHARYDVRGFDAEAVGRRTGERIDPVDPRGDVVWP